MQKRDYLNIIEGTHPKEEDSNEKATESWAALDEGKTSKSEIERAPSWLPSNPPCIQEKNQQKDEDVKVMVEEYMKNDPDQKKDQGNHSYIEIWFQTVTKLQHHSLPQLYLILSKSNHLVSEIQVHVKAYIASLHIILFVILMCTWLHWKYSYT